MTDTGPITDEELAAMKLLVERLRAAADKSENGGGEWFQLVHRCREAAGALDAILARNPPEPPPTTPSPAVAAYMRAWGWETESPTNRAQATENLRRLAAEGIRYEEDRP